MTSLGADKIFFYETNIHEGIKKVIYLKTNREAYCAPIFIIEYFSQKMELEIQYFSEFIKLKNKSNLRETEGKLPK